MNSQISRLAEKLAESSRTVAFTGAGMSTESAIPDYRSPGGQWSKHTPPLFQEFMAGEEGRRKYWLYYSEIFPILDNAVPNKGHLALSHLYKEDNLAGVVTQNIDGLHQLSGMDSRAVSELHGNAFTSRCLKCGKHQEKTSVLLEDFNHKGTIPSCPLCGGPLKPTTISFGQALDQSVLQEAFSLCSSAGLLLVIGSSLVVNPAASLPRLTIESGGEVVIINQQPTPLDEFASMVIRESAGDILDSAVELLSE